jgi:hypothetical protein
MKTKPTKPTEKLVKKIFSATLKGNCTSALRMAQTLKKRVDQLRGVRSRTAIAERRALRYAGGVAKRVCRMSKKKQEELGPQLVGRYEYKLKKK